MSSEDEIERQQTGAPIRGTVRKGWITLPKVSAVEVTRRLIGSASACKVNALDIIKADKSQLISCYQRMVGRLGYCNPFLSEENEEADDGSGNPALPAGCSRLQCEDALQGIMKDQCNVVVACLRLLNIMNDSMVTKAKRIFADSLEAAESSVWFSWNQFVGVDLESMSEEQQLSAERAMEKWWKLMAKVYDRLGTMIIDSGSGPDVAKDVEVGLKEWRNHASLVKGSVDFAEIFVKERLVFNSYALGQLTGMTWPKRREALMKLIERKDLGLDTILDIRRVELTIADDYNSWMESAGTIFKLAESKGITLHTEREKHQEKPKKANPDVPDQKPTPPPSKPPVKEFYTKPKPPVGDRCFKCGQIGHWANRCPSTKQEEKPQQEMQRLIPGSGSRPQNPVPKSNMPPPAIKRPDDKKQPYQTRSGRTVNRPVMVTFGDPIEETWEEEEEGVKSDDSPQHQSLRTIAVPAREIPMRELRRTDEMDMPFVDVVLDSVDIVVCGLLDTASNLNYMSKSLFEKVLDTVSADMIDEPKLVVQTMGGSHVVEKNKRVTMNAAIRDVNGEVSEFRPTPFLIFDGDSIPGGSDVLLAADWITNQSLAITSKDDKYVVSLPRPLSLDEKGTQASLTESEGALVVENCLLAVTADGPDMYEDEDDIKESPQELADIMDNLPREAIAAGPLYEEDLIKIKSWVSDPELNICFKPGQEEPPVREMGYPAPWHRQEKLFELISVLEKRVILERVPRNSGKGYSPGFAVKKSGDRIRLVVRFVALNDRLQLPKGCRYHDSTRFRSSLPSFSTYYVVVDVKDAFFRIPTSAEAQPYLHMSVYHPEGFREYRWKRAPQGLCCSPAFWAQLIDSVVNSLERFLNESDDPARRQLLEDCVIVIYADDVVIAAKNPESARLLGQILRQVLMFNNMWVPTEKMQEGYEVEINGLRLKAGKFYPKDELLDKVRNLRRPRDKSELRSALGLMNYVKWSSAARRDIRDTAANDLLDLVHSKRKFIWSEKCETAWQKYVEAFQALPLYTFSITPGIEEVSRYSLVIQTDASLYGIGYATFVIPKILDSVMEDLSQFHLQDYTEVMKLVAVGSRRLTSCETMYLAHDREGLGIHYSLSENKSLIYLFGSVILQTDSRTALSKYCGNELPKDVVESSSTNRGRRWLCWISDLSDVLKSVRWTHVQGKDNSLADYLSRYAMSDLLVCHQCTQTDPASTLSDGGGMCRVLATTGESSVEAAIASATTPELVSAVSETPALSAVSEEIDGAVNSPEFPSFGTPEIQRLLTDWSSDDTSLYIKNIKLQDVYRHLCGEQLVGVSGKVFRKIREVSQKRFSIFDNGFGKILLYHGNVDPVTVIPDVKIDGFPLRTYLVRYVHEISPLAAHRGSDSCKSLLRRVVWFPRMDLACDLWVNSCVPCTVAKSNRVSGVLNSRKLQFVNQLIVCDWAGPLAPNPSGFRFCLFVVDAFSGFVYAQAFKNKTAADAVEGILSYASLFGFPERFSSDNDPSFCGEVNSKFREAVGIIGETVPTYSPASSGSAEAAVKRLKEALTIWAVESEIFDWVLLLKGIVFSANSTPRYHSQLSPFEIMLGRKPSDPLIASLGCIPEIHDESPENYVSRLRVKLNEICLFWRSKVMEARNRAVDSMNNDCVVALSPGDRCLRVCYVSGRRKVLYECEIIERVRSSSRFRVRKSGSSTEEEAHAYQLIKLTRHPDRIYPSRSTPVPAPTPAYESYYIIQAVLEYCPQRGYFVDWRGYPASERSWQRPRDMPPDPEIREGMRLARMRYHNSR